MIDDCRVITPFFRSFSSLIRIALPACLFVASALGGRSDAADLFNIVHRRRTKVHLVKERVYKGSLVTQHPVSPDLVNRHRFVGGRLVKTEKWEWEHRVNVKTWRLNVRVHIGPETTNRLVKRRVYRSRLVTQAPVNPVDIVKSFPSLEKD